MTATHDAEGATPDRSPDEAKTALGALDDLRAQLHKAREVKQLAEQHADSLTRKVAWANQEEANLAALPGSRATGQAEERGHAVIVVGTTIASFAMSEPDAWSSWLKHAERQQAMAAELGHDLRHFAAIQVDARGIEPFADLCQAITDLGGEWWTYSLDDGRTSVTMTNRWRHIVCGQNLVVDYCQARPDCTHLLFLAADCAASSDIIPRMLEMDHPLVAPYITTYGLRGETVDRYPFHVEDAMASAAALFIARDVFRRIRFRWDLDAQMSDDPCFHHDAKTLLGIPTYVRHDVLARHYPEAVGAYETRFNPSELEIQR